MAKKGAHHIFLTSGFWVGDTLAILAKPTNVNYGDEHE